MQEPSRLHDLLAAPAGATLFTERGRRIDGAAFERLCGATAAWLRAAGVGPGERVAVWLVNRVEWLALLFAAERLGATVVAVNTRYRSQEVQYILSRSQASLLLVQPHVGKLDFPAILADVDSASLPALRTIAFVDPRGDEPRTLLGRRTLAFAPADADDARGAAADGPADPDRPLILFTTSGTTRGPKLVVHSSRTMAVHARNVAAAYGFGQPGDCLLAALPLCGVFGLDSVLGALAAGMPVVLQDVFEADAAAALIREHRVSHLFGSDEMLRRLAEAAGAGDAPLPSLRTVGFAAFGSGAVELATALDARGIPMRGLYGSSEVHALFSMQPAALPMSERALGGGRPAACEARVRVRDPESGELCAVGEAGEIEIAAPTNFLGYLDDAQASAAALTADGYFRTGDLGYLRADGSFVYLARMGDALRLGGFLVDPAEIEHAICGHDGVAAAQVVAVDVDGKPRPVAFVMAQPGGSPALEAIAHDLRARMAGFKVPARLWLVDEFPVTASANGVKVQRVRLRAMAQERLAAERAPA